MARQCVTTIALDVSSRLSLPFSYTINNNIIIINVYIIISLLWAKIHTVYPQIKAWASISYNWLSERRLFKTGLYLRQAFIYLLETRVPVSLAAASLLFDSATATVLNLNETSYDFRVPGILRASRLPV